MHATFPSDDDEMCMSPPYLMYALSLKSATMTSMKTNEGISKDCIVLRRFLRFEHHKQEPRHWIAEAPEVLKSKGANVKRVNVLVSCMRVAIQA